MTLSDIGHAVRTRRTELGLSQVQLARLSGLSRQTLVGLENGTLNDLGINRVAQRFIEQSEAAYARREYNLALEQIKQGLEAEPDNERLLALYDSHEQRVRQAASRPRSAQPAQQNPIKRLLNNLFD